VVRGGRQVLTRHVQHKLTKGQTDLSRAELLKKVVQRHPDLTVGNRSDSRFAYVPLRHVLQQVLQRQLKTRVRLRLVRLEPAESGLDLRELDLGLVQFRPPEFSRRFLVVCRFFRGSCPLLIRFPVDVQRGIDIKMSP